MPMMPFRGADLMAHGGQKRTLGLVGHFGFHRQLVGLLDGPGGLPVGLLQLAAGFFGLAPGDSEFSSQ